MAKADYTRDYYADLELPSTADVTDIKKQFRKLALRYHPDRNPGKEAEVNAKFQTIQAAHEILTSPEQKSKYDTLRARTSSRYPTASGVRGNPWQDYGSQFPTPPRRSGQAPTSAARNTPSSSSSARPSASHPTRNSRFSNFAPPPKAEATKEDLDSRYAAWQRMRPNPHATPGQSASAAYAAANAGGAGPSTGANTRKKASAAAPGASAGPSYQHSSMPPPPPPRTASQRQKADASFGTRRNNGFVPSSPMGDEPPAANSSNYFTQRPHPTRPVYEHRAPPPPRTPAASGRDSRNGSDESLFDARQSTPYQTHGGEKFSLFDTVPVSDLNRAKSNRASDAQGRPEPRRRSSSLPDECDNAAKAFSSSRTGGGGEEAASASAGASATTANTSAHRTGSRARPGAGQRASYVPSSSTMPQFEEQYRKMQGEHEQQQQQREQQQDPFTTPTAKTSRKNGPSEKPDTKGKSSILYAHIPPPPIPNATPCQDPRPDESSHHHPPGKVPHDARPQAATKVRHPGLAPYGSDQFFGYNSMSSPVETTPVRSASEGRHADSTRSQWFSPAYPQGPVYGSHYASIYETPRQFGPGSANTKRRASTPPSFNGPPSGGTDACSNASAGRQPKTCRRSMNAFEAKQFKFLEGLVSSVGVYQPPAASELPTRESCKGQEPQRHAPSHPPNRHSGLNKPSLNANVRDINSRIPSSANLTLDDDVFSSPATPVDQQKKNPFASISVEDINTRFVSDDSAKTTWEFSAGGSETDPNSDHASRIHRPQSGNRLGRRSPGKPNAGPRPDASQTQPPPRPTSSTGGAADGSTDSASGSSGDGGGASTRGSYYSMNGNSKPGASTTTTTDYFDPQRWSEQIGSEHFIPAPSHQGPSMPPRQSTPNQQPPRPIKKPKPVSRTTTNPVSQPPPGRTYIVIDDDSDDSVADDGSGGMASPVAMDIDSPPTGQPSSGAKADARSSINSSPTGHAAGGVRNIPVEPTRPEWRAGNVDKSPTASAAPATDATGNNATPMNPFAAASAVSAMAAAAAAAAAADPDNANSRSSSAKAAGSVPPPPPPPPAAMGSEDSEEFHSSLADIRKVEPFAESVSGIQGKAGTGLGSFGDLKSHLPFDSKAATPLTAAGSAGAGAGPTSTASRRKTISFPKAPMAPHPPAVLAVPGLQPSSGAWDKYVSEFRHYMAEWNVFNTLYVDHFVARRKDFVSHPRQPRAMGDMAAAGEENRRSDWIAEVDDEGIDQYLGWLEQDEQVRARWTQACADHSDNVRQFKRYRNQMRQAQA